MQGSYVTIPPEETIDPNLSAEQRLMNGLDKYAPEVPLIISKLQKLLWKGESSWISST